MSPPLHAAQESYVKSRLSAFRGSRAIDMSYLHYIKRKGEKERGREKGQGRRKDGREGGEQGSGYRVLSGRMGMRFKKVRKVLMLASLLPDMRVLLLASLLSERRVAYVGEEGDGSFSSYWALHQECYYLPLSSVSHSLLLLFSSPSSIPLSVHTFGNVGK